MIKKQLYLKLNIKRKEKFHCFSKRDENKTHKNILQKSNQGIMIYLIFSSFVSDEMIPKDLFL